MKSLITLLLFLIFFPLYAYNEEHYHNFITKLDERERYQKDLIAAIKDKGTDKDKIILFESQKNKYDYDFKEYDLKGAPLAGRNLSNLNLAKAHLEGSDLSGCIIVNTCLSEAHLAFADCSHVIFKDVICNNLDARFALFFHATLNGLSQYKNINLAGAYLYGSPWANLSTHSTNKKSFLPLCIRKDQMLEYRILIHTPEGNSSLKLLLNFIKIYQDYLRHPEHYISQKNISSPSDLDQYTVVKQVDNPSEAGYKNINYTSSSEPSEIEHKKYVIKLENLDMTHLSFQGMVLPPMIFENVDLKNSNLHQLTAPYSRFERCNFSGTNLLLSNLSHSFFQDTRFFESQLYLSDMRWTIHHDTHFLDNLSQNQDVLFSLSDEEDSENENQPESSYQASLKHLKQELTQNVNTIRESLSDFIKNPLHDGSVNLITSLSLNILTLTDLNIHLLDIIKNESSKNTLYLGDAKEKKQKRKKLNDQKIKNIPIFKYANFEGAEGLEGNHYFTKHKDSCITKSSDSSFFLKLQNEIKDNYINKEGEEVTYLNIFGILRRPTLILEVEKRVKDKDLSLFE